MPEQAEELRLGGIATILVKPSERLRFASGSGLAAGRDGMNGATTPATPGKGSHG